MIPSLTDWAFREDTYVYSPSTMALPDIAKEIADFYKIPPPSHTEEGNFPFIFNGSLNVELFSIDKQHIGILAKMGDPKDLSPQPEEFLKKVLQWNFARQHDQQEILTWDPEQKQLILFRRIPITSLSSKNIIANLEQFLETLEFWTAALNQDPGSSIFSPTK